ncbi:MAG: MxaD protein [Rhodospirillaceae bacterium]|nr:MxaD protein [Rhodospirillaceae bacterium]|tara:strand:- start:6382 stop:6819 length:438 start_codon:yes stop_codon:yes gene_type:complete
MTDVSRSIRLEASAADVWALIGPFDSMTSWHPAVLDSVLGSEDGRMVRRLLVVGGIRVTEVLLHHDDHDRHYRYAIADGGRLPVVEFTATLRVKEDSSDACEVVWSSTFMPAGAPDDVAAEAISGIFDAGLNALEDRFRQGDSAT